MSAWTFGLQPQNIHDWSSANWVGKTIATSWFRHIVVEISTSGSANLTIKCQWAMWKWVRWQNSPDFSSAKSVSNAWEYLEVLDLEDGNSPISGDTWITFSGTDDVRLLEINANAIDFVNFEVSGYTAWNVTVRIRPYTNQ